MKVFLRLAILFATLLLVTNMAFGGCSGQSLCYDVYSTKDDGSVDSEGYWLFCLNTDGTGRLCDNDSCMDLYGFGGGTGWFNSSGYPGFVNGNPKWTTWIVSGHDVFDVAGSVQFIGEGGSSIGYLLTGILYDEGDKDVINGRMVAIENCLAP